MNRNGKSFLGFQWKFVSVRKEKMEEDRNFTKSLLAWCGFTVSFFQSVIPRGPNKIILEWATPANQ